MYDIITKAKCIVDYIYFTKSLRGVSRNQHVPKSTIQRWVSQDAHGKKIIQKRKQKEKKQCKTEIVQFIEYSLSKNPFMTMNDLSKHLFTNLGIKMSSRTIQRNVTLMGYTYKKAVNVIDHNHDNVQVRQFCAEFERAFNLGILYSVDEAGINVGDHPRYGRSKRGKRLAIATNKSLRKTKFSLAMAVGVNGIVASEVIDHNYKKADFIRFFTNIQLPYGSVILMDNLRAHHCNEVRDILTSKGITILFSPPYSPRCNPIEKVFGLLKPLYRKGCPSIESSDKEEYKTLFLSILIKHRMSDFSSTFRNTCDFIKETILNIDTNPEFKFVGYDIGSFIKINEKVDKALPQCEK